MTGKLLTAHYVDGFTSDEIAERMALNPVTVRVRISRAKSKLRSYLNVGSYSDNQAVAAL